jgi:hypothetical protein
MGSEYIYIFRAYRDGKLSDILRDLDRCDSASTVLFTISEYRMVRLRYASEQGYMAGRLLTAYISLKGYAPITRKILYEWVRRMLAVSSREKAEHNIELLWRDKHLVNLQKNAVEEVIRELSKEGLENLAINPPKPIQKILETLIKCPGCGSQPIYGEKYCKQCGTRIPTKAWETTEETHKPITVEIERKAMFSRLSITNPSAVGRSEIWQWFFNYPVTKAAAAYPGSRIDFASLVTGPLVTPGLRYAYFVQVSWTVLLFTLPVMGYMLLLSRSDKVARFFIFFWLGGLIGWVIVNAFFRGLIYLFYILTMLPPVILAISYYLGGKLYLEEKTKQVRWTALTLLYCVLHLVNFFLLYPVPIP